ncbi:MAG: ABC transporter ATP-binding protein [Clostridiales bacterium]
MIILEGISLCKFYGTEENIVRAVNNINFQVNKGEFISITGQSGSGKSTLMHLIGGLDKPTSGEVIINNTSIYSIPENKMAIFRRKNIGFIFQAFNLIPVLNVWENVILPIGLDGKKADIEYIEDILNMLDIYNKRINLPNTLSGGQQQRVAIARALATKPSIILADEPTGNLDSKTSREVLNLLKLSVEKYKQTLIVVTHDNEIAKLADRVVNVIDGQIL